MGLEDLGIIGQMAVLVVVMGLLLASTGAEATPIVFSSTKNQSKCKAAVIHEATTSTRTTPASVHHSKGSSLLKQAEVT